jgi:hypothetical protein
MPSKRSSLKTGAIFAVVLAIVGVAATIVAVPPDTWKANLASWRQSSVDFLIGSWPWLFAALTGIVGVMAGRYLIPVRRQPRNSLEIASESDFARRVKAMSLDVKVTKIDVLAYTGETFPDVISYEQKNDPDLRIRFLTRNWEQERLDEEAYNARLNNDAIRRWKKSATIESSARSEWTLSSDVERRFYSDLHPILKFISVRFSDQSTLAFVSFYQWIEYPPNGGSPFKGANRSGFILGSSEKAHKDLMSYLQSQYEFIWNFRTTASEGVSNIGHKTVFGGRA